MSTRLYNGQIIRNCTLETMLTRLKTIRSKCVELAQSSIANELAKKRTFWFDMDTNYLPFPRQKFEPPFWRLMELLKAEETKVATGTRSGWDFTFTICLIPKGKNLLALHYLENDPGYLNALKEIGFEDYHFQNSTDKPDAISEQEWANRSQDWDEALGNAPPADSGFTFDLVRWDDVSKTLWNHELVLASTPTDESRRFEVALRLAGTDLEPFDDKNTIFSNTQN